MNDPVSVRLIDLQWLSLACRIKTSLRMDFKAFLDLPVCPSRITPLSQTYVHPSANQARRLRIATASPGFPLPRFCRNYSFHVGYPSPSHLNPSLPGRLPGEKPPPLIALPSSHQSSVWGLPHLTGAPSG